VPKPERIGLGAIASDHTSETARLAETARQIERHSQASPATDDDKAVVISVNLPLALLSAMREAADRRALRLAREHPRGRGGRPSVSAIVVDILQRHRDEIDGIE
jgi:hypothetical protein